MICTAPQLRAAASEWQARFLVMLPLIETHARLVFRRLDPEARDDAVQEVLCQRVCRIRAAGRTPKS